MGMKRMSAKGSRLESTSFGTPFVTIVAAWETRLLFSWLYVSPVKRPRQYMTPFIKYGRRTVDGEPAEHAARLEAALDLVDPLVVERHPRGTVLSLKVAGLDVFPKVCSGQVPHGLKRVQRPTALHRRAPEAHGLPEDGAGRRRTGVHIVARGEDEGADEEDDSRQGVC